MSTAITGSPLPSTGRLTIVRVRTRRAKQIQERLELVHGLEEESHVWAPERGQEREPGLLKIPDRPEMHDTVGESLPARMPSTDAAPMSSSAANTEMPSAGTPSSTYALAFRAAWAHSLA